jgi:predicted amino acid-binding ACT domain protein
MEVAMPDTIRVVDYYVTTTSDKAGEGAKLLGTLRNARTNLLALSAFPSKRKTQVDFVPADSGAFLSATKAAKIKLSKPKKVFLIQGDDRVGAIQEVLAKLASAKINVKAVQGVTAGGGRYGAILWVDQKNVKKAATALGATMPTAAPTSTPPMASTAPAW